MTESFKPQSLTVNEFLNNADSFYQIPKYQRPYKWIDDQVDKLWEDLWDSYKTNTENYFLGSIITAKQPEDQYLDVVDGQQRLTTLTILMAVVRDLYPEINEKDSLNLKTIDITRIKNSISRDGKFQRLRLVTHSNHQSDFDSLIINGNTLELKKPYKKDINRDESPKFKFINTATIFKDKLEEIGLEECENFINYLFNQVYIIRIDCSDVSFAIKLFQVLNARGLDLTNADLTKSFLLGELHKKYKEDPNTAKLRENQFLQDWITCEQIADNVHQSTNDLLVMYEYYLLGSNPKKSLYEELVNQFKDKDPLKIIADFKKFCQNYKNGIIEADDEVTYSLFYIRWSIYWRTVLLTALQTGYPEYNELKLILRNFYYKHWIAGYTLTRVKQTSFNLIKWIKENKPINEIKRELNNVITNNNIQNRIEEALSTDVYNEAWCKPLLFIIEFNQTNQARYLEITDRSIHVEHILPQNFKSLYGWKELIEDKEIAEANIHNLGNLTLLSGSKNIEASNKPFVEKIMIYNGKGKYASDHPKVTSFRISQKLVDDYNNSEENKEWTIENIRKRQLWLLSHTESILDLDLSKIKQETTN